jgi:hypothetical protein
MTWDRFVVFSIALAFMGWANIAPNNFPQEEYGRGFPLKWTFDPNYRPPDPEDNTPPYLRELTPERRWVFDRGALAVDIAVALLVIGVSLAVNELVQTSLGQRPPAIPPNDRVT